MRFFLRLTDSDVLEALSPIEWRFGLDVQQRILDAKGDLFLKTWRMPFAVFYRRVIRLEKAGCVESRWALQTPEQLKDRQGLRRREYRRTIEWQGL